MRLRRRSTLLAMLLALPAFAEEEQGGAKPEEMEASVTVATAKDGEIRKVLRAVATVELRRGGEWTASSRSSGLVKEVDVREGDTVEKGATLAALDDRPLQEAKRKAEVALAAADRELDFAKSSGLDAQETDLDFEVSKADLDATRTRREAERLEALLAEHLGSEKAAVEARQAADAAKRVLEVATEKAKRFKEKGRADAVAKLESAVAGAKIDVEAATRELEGTKIIAAVSGRVTSLSVVPGQKIEAGAALLTIASPEALSARAGIAPGDTKRVKEKAKVTFEAAGGRRGTGTVAVVAFGADPGTGLIPVIVDLDKCEDTPRPGEMVFLEIETGEGAKGLVVPASALVFDGDEAKVVTVDEHDIAHVVAVEVEARNAREAVVKGEGLADGVTVVIEGNYNLPDGAHVKPEQAK